MISSNCHWKLIFSLSLIHFIMKTFVVFRIKCNWISLTLLILHQISKIFDLMTYLNQSINQSWLSNNLWTQLCSFFLLSEAPISTQKIDHFSINLPHYIKIFKIEIYIWKSRTLIKAILKELKGMSRSQERA